MLSDIQVQGFWKRFAYLSKMPEMRKGQAMMNALSEVSPELYAEITGTPLDVWYNDTSQDIYRFREFLGL